MCSTIVTKLLNCSGVEFSRKYDIIDSYNAMEGYDEKNQQSKNKVNIDCFVHNYSINSVEIGVFVRVQRVSWNTVSRMRDDESVCFAFKA